MRSGCGINLYSWPLHVASPDLAVLDGWIEAAAVATSLDDVFSS